MEGIGPATPILGSHPRHDPFGPAVADTRQLRFSPVQDAGPGLRDPALVGRYEGRRQRKEKLSPLLNYTEIGIMLCVLEHRLLRGC